MSHFVIIGAGQAGAALVAKLRGEGFDGQITLIGAEPVPPYQRPPLSKAYLLGDMALERLFLRPAQWYDDNQITLRLGAPVTAIDAASRQVHLGDETLTYDKLALTTGAAPRRLPASIGGDLKGVYVVRDLRDVDAMAPMVTAGKSVLIVGGGYIGLEAAAVCAKKGMQVTLVEMADRILQRVACAETSDYFRELHRAHGVEILEHTGLEALLGQEHVSAARLSTGEERTIDMVIVGVGVTPDLALAESAGLSVAHGIEVDSHGQTSDPAIWAAGDCTIFRYRDAPTRLESVQNAIDQAENVALNMLGQDVAYTPKPWFWSDQYDVKLQIAGLNTGYDSVVIRTSDAATSHWYYQGDTLLAVDAMNDPRNYMIGKRLIEAGRSPDPAVIADPATDMKALLKP